MIETAARLALPLIRLLPAETAHTVTLRALQSLPLPRRRNDEPILASTVFGRRFANPVGLAAGFDKNAEVPDTMLRWGFGFTEIGTVTPRPQLGNPRPRLFRLTQDQAVINRMGFNNEGLEAVALRLKRRRRSEASLLGANLGKNRDSADAVADYCRGVALLGPFADYLVINVSSPNTPGLRDLQRRGELSILIEAVLEERARLKLDRLPPVLLKVAPDLNSQEIEDIALTVNASTIDGLIVSNTTVARPASLVSRSAPEPGGLSGRPLFEASTKLLAELYRLTEGKLPLIGVGGIASGADAYAKIRAGASLVQLYTALVYQGPGLVRRVKTELAELLRRDGFHSLAEAVGSGNKTGVAPKLKNAQEKQNDHGA
jgi:dihydroorotate dehydrogenase